jgi:hypothetical protein
MSTVAGAASRAAMPWQGARGAAPKESGGKGRYLVVKLVVRCQRPTFKVCWRVFNGARAAGVEADLLSISISVGLIGVRCVRAVQLV